MIRDLRLAGDGEVASDAQVCIVGAGTAGLFLARLLRHKDIQVVMVESGDSVARSSTEMSHHCEQRGIPYRGADAGRSFGLGGTSVLWGGQLIPMAESDFDARPEAGVDAWPITYSELAPYLAVVRDHLGLPDAVMAEAGSEGRLKQDFPDLHRLAGDLNLRLSEWLPFRKRNFASSFADMLETDRGLTIWLNAAVTGLTRSSLEGVAPVKSITAQSPDGRILKVRAKTIVLCAGALESTRLLLEFDESSQGSITWDGAPLGRYFRDHLSVTCGRFVCRDRRGYNAAVAPIFSHGVMRTPRLELTAAAQRGLGLPSAFAHMTFVTPGDTGFDALRSILRRRQGERPSLHLAPKTLARLATDAFAMAYWRWVHDRLWIPRTADLLLQVDAEQLPNPDSRLSLSSERDARNRRKLVIDWRITPADVRTIRQMARIVAAGWETSPLRQFADLEPTLPEEFDSFSSLYDVYHPTGSLQMGTSPRNSVVDKDLRLWRTPNCFVNTTAIFPSAGSANPGMTHLSLTARLADELARQFRG